MIKVFVNGFGIIGRRIAGTISEDPEIELIGVSKYTINDGLKELVENEYKLFVPKEAVDSFTVAGYNLSGTVKQAVTMSDIIVDAAKDGFGIENMKKLYQPLGKPAIFQGGEDGLDLVHNTRCNYDVMHGLRYVKQGSCNVTAIGRILQPLLERYNSKIKRVDIELIRRWADLEDNKEVKDSIEWDPNSHHVGDVKCFLPDIPLFIEVVKVPSRMMHLHRMYVRFDDKSPSKDEILKLYEDEFGVAVLYTAKGTADVRLKAQELDFPYGDTNMAHIHANVVRVEEDVLKLPYSVDQTGIVVPDNHLLIQGMMMGRKKSEALANTDSLMRMSQRKNILQEAFA